MRANKYLSNQIILYLLVGLLLGLTACGGASQPADDIQPVDQFTQAETPSSANGEATQTEGATQLPETAPEMPATENQPAVSGELDGPAVVQRMETAVRAVQSIYGVAQFQMTTADGGVRGKLEAWGEKPNKTRVVITSESEDLAGVEFLTDEFAGWISSPYQKTFYMSQNYPGTPHLSQQPELHEISRYAREIWEQGGLGEIQATLLGNETINGRPTYLVEVVPQSVPEFLQDVVLLFWVDHESFLPQQIEMRANFLNMSGRGTITVQQMTVNQPLDPAVFEFVPPPDDFVVVNLDAITAPVIPPGEELVPDTN